MSVQPPSIGLPRHNLQFSGPLHGVSDPPHFPLRHSDVLLLLFLSASEDSRSPSVFLDFTLTSLAARQPVDSLTLTCPRGLFFP